MSLYLNAAIMLAATITAFVLLAKMAQAIRSRHSTLVWKVNGFVQMPTVPSRLAVEQTCVVDAKRKLILIRCDEQRVLLLTGGPDDIIVSVLPQPQVSDADV